MNPQESRVYDYLLSKVTSAVPLEIRQSSIPGAGMGLFATQDIAEGHEIYQSNPLVACVEDEKQEEVCDYCLLDTTSAVLPTGRFRMPSDTVTEHQRCSGCRVCYYCSTVCQRKAWEEYHRGECELLKENKELHSRTRLLYRLLTMHSGDLINAEDWKSLDTLSAHDDDILAREDASITMGACIGAASITKTSLGVQDVVKLYCTLLTNCIPIRSQEGGRLGAALDLVSAVLNHDCNPNAVIIFEGRQLRLRSLRKITAGDEILQSYVDTTVHVATRLRILESEYFITCICPRCITELRVLHHFASGNADQITKLTTAQRALHTFLTRILTDKDKSDQSAPDLRATEHSINRFIRSAFPSTNAWPVHLPPAAKIHTALALVAGKNQNYEKLLYHGLRGYLYLRTSVQGRDGVVAATGGIDGVQHLFNLVGILMVLVRLPRNDAFYTKSEVYSRTHCQGQTRTQSQTQGQAQGQASGFSKKDMWTVFLGYLVEFEKSAVKVFGADSAYARAVKSWLVDAVREFGKPRPGTKKFAEGFAVAQGRVLRWAGIEEGLGIGV
ncbi:hypothetical protein BJX61DRAFT_541554 [Aspergillus egyptiacus]|nr:hypothetical protein BJX61DRAFT_541554 [Aspergillus egyptiacus]